MLPTLKIVLGDTGDVLSDALLDKFIADPEHTIMILPSTEQVKFAAHLASVRLSCPTAEILEKFTTFGTLVSNINHQRKPNARSISRTLKRLLLSQVMQTYIVEDSFFGKMLDAPGFVPALADCIREWKLADLFPVNLEETAAEAAVQLENPAYEKKAVELSLIFSEYNKLLKNHQLQDEEDCLWEAVDLLDREFAKLPCAAATILVDGFYRFSYAQRKLLAAIAGQGLSIGEPRNELVVSLPYNSKRPLLFAAPQRTLTHLRKEFNTDEETLTEDSKSLNTALTMLGKRIFSPGLSEMPPCKLAAENRIKIFDAPNPYVESEMVAREFRRLHDTEGIAWKDMTIILRTMGEYAPILSAVCERYKVPLDVDGPEIIDENPVVKTLLAYFRVIRNHWQKEDVFAFLKSSYTFPDKIEVEHLRKKAAASSVREGSAAFLNLTGSNMHTALHETIQHMVRFEALLTNRPMEIKEFEGCIHSLIETFGIKSRIDSGEPSRQERDNTAMDSAIEALQAMAEIGSISKTGPITFNQFLDELAPCWSGKAVVACAPSDQVRVAEPYDSRKHPIHTAAVMGLTERGFPRRISEDPFLRDEERQMLRKVANVDLEDIKDRSDDERFFFYLSVTAPADRLILSFPRSIDNSDALPSFYLDEVRSVFASHNTKQGTHVPEVVSRTLADVAPRAEECVTDEDLLLAGCADLFDPGIESDSIRREEKQIAAKELLKKLLSRENCGIKTRDTLVSRRLPRIPNISVPKNRSLFTKRRLFTVSELETYQRCPFQYLLQYKLKLRPQRDGAGRIVQGTVLHEVLRRHSIQSKNRKITLQTESEQLEQMKLELRKLLLEIIETQQLDARSHRILMAQRMISNALDRFAEREMHFQPLFGMTPAHFELAFGPDEPIDEADIPIPTRTRDAGSTMEALVLSNDDNSLTISICGRIDRVDIGDTTGRAIIIDYKLGQAPDFKEMQNGRSLQMPLYMMAAERLFGLKPVAACYDSAEDQGRPRIFRMELGIPKVFGVAKGLDKATSVTPLNRDQYADLIKNAEASALRIASEIISVRVDATPGNHCKFCDYSDVCRTTVIDGHDGE